MLSMNDIKKGKVIEFEQEPYVVVSSEFMRKQKARPVMRTVIKNLKTGQTKEHTWQQSDKVAEANVQSKDFQFLYQSGDKFSFMNQETFDQIELDVDVIGDNAKYLLEGQIVSVMLFENEPVSIELPIKVERKVIEAPPGVKGDTTTNVMKDVVIEGGTKMKAPLFVKEGESIVIDTRSGEYVEKAKS